MRGATLVELLFAMVLAGLALAGALTGLAHAQRVWLDAERLGRMHERAQYVFGTLEPEIQMAGYFGPDADPQPSGRSEASSCGDQVVLPLWPPVRVLAGEWLLPCPPQGGGAQTGSDVLLLRRASARIAAAVDGAIQVQSPLQPEDRRDLHVRIYYIAHAADGDPGTHALRVKSLTAVAGQPAFVDTEVMPGIVDLQVELLPDAASPRSARVRLRVQADAADLRRNESPPELALERRFTLRNNGTT